MQLRVSVQSAGGTGHGLVDDATSPCRTTRRRRCRSARRACSARARRATSRRSRPMPRRCRRPTATFSRTERLLVRVDAYAPGSVPPAVTARLLNRAGHGDVRCAGAGGRSAAAAEMELAFASLAAGEYLLELNAKAEAGKPRRTWSPSGSDELRLQLPARAPADSRPLADSWQPLTHTCRASSSPSRRG